MGEVFGPSLMQLAAYLVAVAAAVGVPAFLADRETRARRVGLLLVLAAGLLLIHGELRSDPVLHGALICGAAALAAVLFGHGARGWLLRRAILAERPRSPDEWTPQDGRRLWAGTLRAREPLPALEGGVPPCVYRRVEVDRWDAGRWRRIATSEHRVDALELAGRSRVLLAPVPLPVLRRGAVELEKFRACPDGWRLDADPDPAALYRVRTVGVPDGAALRVLARAERRGELGLSLVGASPEAFSWTDAHPAHLGRRAGLCAAAALACALLSLWGAWPS